MLDDISRGVDFTHFQEPPGRLVEPSYTLSVGSVLWKFIDKADGERAGVTKIPYALARERILYLLGDRIRRIVNDYPKDQVIGMLY
jgi:hypothetical protein